MFRPTAVFLAPPLVCALLLVSTTGAVMGQEKIKIEKLDDLPRHTYQIEGTAVEFLTNEEAIRKVAEKLRQDLESDLATYEIPDKTTIKSYYATLGTIALLDKRYDDYLSYLALRRELEDKEAARLTTGLMAESYVAAVKSGGDLQPEFEKAFASRVNPLPYEVVEASVKQSKGMMEILTAALIEGSIQASVQPVLDETGGEASKDVASGLLSSAFAVNVIIPLAGTAAEVYAAYLDAHATEKPDIWADREVTLSEGDAEAPVLVAIWDTGVDAAVFGATMWVNENEIPDNDMDDDENGFVDDVNGIGYTLDAEKTSEPLFPIGDLGEERPRLQRQSKGLDDITSGIDSEEATEVKKVIRELSQEEVGAFLEDLGRYGNHAHGTHVAGIAARGNPYIRLMSVRFTAPHEMIPPEPTFPLAYREAAQYMEVGDYLRDHGVRVVNMSWGGSLSYLEQALEAHDVGETPEERKALAREMFEIGKAALERAIRNTPEVLYITSAGNSDNDVIFEEFIPSGFDLPNIMSVGAVDQAGDETGFTSFGKVDVYANGFEVMSYVPGGDEMKFSGTSMSSPNVVNLAAKILAVRPDLTPAQVREIIEETCEEKQAGERMVKLINPKAAFARLAETASPE